MLKQFSEPLQAYSNPEITYSFRVKFSLLLAYVAGLVLVFYWKEYQHSELPQLCLFKSVSGIPCPACGSTKALWLTFHGHWMEGILTNPIAFVTLFGSTIGFVMLLMDIVLHKRYFEKILNYLHKLIIGNSYVKWTFILLLLVNWIWNITKMT